MRVLSVCTNALTYGALGGFAALVSHELGYAGVHDVGVDHSHISVLATWAAAPVLLAVARLLVTSDRVSLGRLIRLAFALLLLLELGERAAQAIPLTSVLSTPVLLAVAVIPAGVVIVLVPLGVGRRMLATVRLRESRVILVDGGPVASRVRSGPGRSVRRATCARSPPFWRPNGDANDRIGDFDDAKDGNVGVGARPRARCMRWGRGWGDDGHDRRQHGNDRRHGRDEHGRPRCHAGHGDSRS